MLAGTIGHTCGVRVHRVQFLTLIVPPLAVARELDSQGAPRPANPVTCFPPGKVVAKATKGGQGHRSRKALISTQKILQRETAGFDDWQG